MADIAVDTLQQARDLKEAGLAPEHAEAIASAINRSAAASEVSLATKSDMKEFQQSTRSEFESFRQEMRSEFEAFRQEMRSEFEAFRVATKRDLDAIRTETARDLARLENKLTIRMYAMGCGIVGATTALVKLL